MFNDQHIAYVQIKVFPYLLEIELLNFFISFTSDLSRKLIGVTIRAT